MYQNDECCTGIGVDEEAARVFSEVLKVNTTLNTVILARKRIK